MKGIVLAGGTGSCLSRLTAVTNKHLLPAGNYSMVFHPIARLKHAGIKDILVVTGRDHMGDVMELLGSGHDFGLDFTYKVHDQAGCPSSDIYAASDIAGLTSRTEGLPCALLEAGASGLPLFGCKVGGIPEVIEDGSNGLLFESADATVLAHALDRLARDRNLREFIGQGGHVPETCALWIAMWIGYLRSTRSC